jgi:hypothetical protein
MGESTMTEFNRGKFTEAMLHVAARSSDDSTFGATKLNKILFYADFIHYAEYGQSITGATYRKLNYGPVPRQLPEVQAELLDAGDARIEENNRLGLRQKRLIPGRPADLSAFSDTEQAVLESVIEALAGKTAGAVSAMSHLEPGWRLASMFEDIPYQTVFLVEPTLTDDDIAWGQKIAAERGFQLVG